MSEQVEPQRAAELLENGAQAVDVREQYEWDAGHIEGARHIELPQQIAGFFNPLAGLAGGGGGHDDERARVMPGVMKRLDGCDGGFAPLTGATKNQPIGRSPQDFGLNGVGLPMQFALDPSDGIDCSRGTR